MKKRLNQLPRHCIAGVHMPNKRQMMVDAIHGDIEISHLEKSVIDTAPFQRLRHLKQLQMGHVTYPNATHTRFAHSIGVMGIMQHVTRVAKEPLNLNATDIENLRLVGLLHDIGHYPYSHLMENIDSVELTEEFVKVGKTTINLQADRYPSHEELGKLIITTQKELISALGDKDRAEKIATMLIGDPSQNPQLAKLIHSSLDMDRLDYLLRDSHSTGVPYGNIDLNYIVNNLRVSPSGILGVNKKALSAVEHVLIARFFMHKTVYYHKTTYGLEEATRQLIRRIRDIKEYKFPSTGAKIKELSSGAGLLDFTDAYIDARINRATKSKDKIISTLANAIARRQPPKLLKETSVFVARDNLRHNAGITFRRRCQHDLQSLSKKYKIPLGLFLYCETKPIKFEKRGSHFTTDEIRTHGTLHDDEIVQVFQDGEEPVSIMDIESSLLHVLSNRVFLTHRLYVVEPNLSQENLQIIRSEVAGWDK